jgi:hypothetical protein
MTLGLPGESLDPLEEKILIDFVRGLRAEDIGKKYNYSAGTIRNKYSDISRKMNATDMTEAAIKYSHRLGLLRLPLPGKDPTMDSTDIINDPYIGSPISYGIIPPINGTFISTKIRSENDVACYVRCDEYKYPDEISETINSIIADAKERATLKNVPFLTAGF